MRIVRAPSQAGLREGRGCLGRALLVLVIVGIIMTRFIRRRVGRVMSLLSRRLRVIRRSPRHCGSRVCPKRGDEYLRDRVAGEEQGIGMGISCSWIVRGSRQAHTRESVRTFSSRERSRVGSSSAVELSASEIRYRPAAEGK